MKPLRPTPALLRAVQEYLATRNEPTATHAMMRRVILLGRARIVSPSLRRVSDDEVIRLAIAVCS